MDNLRYFDKIRYGSFKDLDVLVDPSDNSLWVTYPTIEKMLGYKEYSASEKLATKSLKTFAGKALAAGKNVSAIDSIGRLSEVDAVPFDTFLSLVYFEAFEGKAPYQTNARSLVVAGFANSFSTLTKPD